MSYLSAQHFFNDFVELLRINNRDISPYKFVNNKIYNAIYYQDYCALRIKKQKDSLAVFLKSSAKKLLDKHSVTYNLLNSSKDKFMIKINISNREDINTFRNFFVALQDNFCLTLNKDSFSCCSRYEECSNAMRCVSKYIFDKYMCKYHINLISGKIFYGIHAVYDSSGNISDKLIEDNRKKMNVDAVIPIPLSENEQLSLFSD